MSGDVPFHLTVNGRRFYEHQLPELLRLLAELSERLDRVAKVMETAPR